ncbi:uncharacterized protein LOC133791945 [Humulus lupulus]|uniref:uncharacterized protein LOC133791945 n=1 Tax=Humulus lupulus TaxID=3486 RepID=UPI002B40E323|nr:uncharacterized protein LOC133791945 [Humulus lupulus]
MGEVIRHRSNGVARNIETVHARYLSENRTYTGWSSNNHHKNNQSSLSLSSSKNLSSSKQRVLKASKSSSQSLKWWWNDPEMKRQRRITSYKLYSAEANVKSSFKKGLRWLGKKCSMIIRRI